LMLIHHLNSTNNHHHHHRRKTIWTTFSRQTQQTKIFPFSLSLSLLGDRILNFRGKINQWKKKAPNSSTSSFLLPRRSSHSIFLKIRSSNPAAVSVDEVTHGWFLLWW